MGPPPVPPFTPSSVQNSKDPREFSDKYYKLKRKYWELEEVGFPSILLIISPSSSLSLSSIEIQGPGGRAQTLGRAKCPLEF
jgi:hypothetical protein